MGSSELLLLIGLFLLGVAVYLFVSTLLGESDQQAALSWANEGEPEKSKNNLIEMSRPLAHRFSMNLAMRFKNKEYRKKVDEKIKTAGLAKELNVDEFIALQVLWGIFLPLFLIIMNFALELGFSEVFILLLGAVGAYFPHIYCDQQKKQRQDSVRVDLPFFVDLIALCTIVGVDFTGAIKILVDKAEKSVLADEFAQVLQDINLGRSRREALRDMSERLDMSEITSFVAVLVDSADTGADIGEVLKQQSVQMRVERFARAEKAGARASQLMLLPMMIFIMPAIMVMIFGPVILQFLGMK